ncbi:hypothetical protein [Halobaculum sp. EA56]|uniref:hypothetical protein n=1 Tax=Halobaculum sp. EA56 TaxID=3421648 RepID=UPI003EBB76E2
MVSVETAVFECASCGTCAPSTGIDYDSLGYAVCPECGETESPLIRRRPARGRAVR